MLKFIALIFCSLWLPSTLFAALPTGYPVAGYESYSTGEDSYYYVSLTGSDSIGDGSLGSPWRTLEKALLSVSGGSTIYLREGNYGKFYQLSNDGYSAGWVTIRPYPGELAIFTSFQLSFDERYYPSNFRMDGIAIHNDGGDVKFGIDIRFGKNIELRNLAILGSSKYTDTYGVKITSAENVLIYGCDISTYTSGVYTIGSSTVPAKNITVDSNHIHHLGGATPYSYSVYCDNAIVRRNYLHDSKWVSGAVDAPLVQTHGSCVSVRSGNVLIEENYCHDLGSSSAIMTYTDSGSALSYSDVYIYNNVIYDIINDYAVRLYNAADRVEIKNNTIVGWITTNSGSWKLSNALFIHSLYAGNDGSGVTVTNNVLVGKNMLPLLATISGNIMYSVSEMNDPYTMLASWSGNTVLTAGSSEPITYFTNGFFVGPINLLPQHGYSENFSLLSNSPAVNYGNSSTILPSSIGKLDNFRVSASIPRGLSHSAGADEYVNTNVDEWVLPFKSNGKATRAPQ